MVKSLDRALTILEYLSKRKSAGVTEIANHYGIDKGTVSRIMQTFEKHGMVAKNVDNFKYRVSNGTLQLSHNVLLNNRVVAIARPTLHVIADMTDATARLCMLDGKQVFIVDQTRKRHGGDVNDADIPGTMKPMHCSAIGKTLLANMPEATAIAWIEKMPLTAYTENTLTDKEAILAELEQIRQRGYALNLAEFSDRAYCVAVPVFCEDNEPPKYAIGITGWSDFRENQESFAKIIHNMKEASAKITMDYRTNRIRQMDQMYF